MKKTLFRLFLWVFVLTISLWVSAQNNKGNQKLPVDPKVKIVKLDNGFTYYIRANHKPEKRIEMRLVVNAGSVLESDNQLGLAHFVEHMCFNGTAHFEKNELVHYLQSIGIKFGAEINAYTSFDETVYMLTIPSDSVNLVEKGFLVMEDWAHNVSFDEQEIDKERGVLIEEWRLGRGPWQRMEDKYLPVVFKDSRYAERLPIGKKEIIENAPYDTLRSFYRNWYRPDLMALIVVGDIDPDVAEKKIQEHFMSFKMPSDPIERKMYQVPDQPETLVSVATDKEAPNSQVSVIYKSDVEKFDSYNGYLDMLKYYFLTGMLNRRLDELTEKENPPFIQAGFGYGSQWARTKSELQGDAIVGEKGINRGLKTLLAENKRLSSYGFTQGEFERYKLDLLKLYENSYNERDKTESSQLADEYVRNFLEDEPIPGIEFEYQYVKENIISISLDNINNLAKELITGKNRVIIVDAPDKEGIEVPSENKVLDIAKSIDTIHVLPYEDKLTTGELMNSLPEPGKIVSEQKLADIDAIDLKLSNGSRVILKPTKFKNDEILLSAFSKGGHSVYPESDHFTAINADGIVQESGVADFSPSDLRKLLAGKSIYVAPVINYETEAMNAQTKISDVVSMFQLMYLYFTNPRVDEGAFNSYIAKNKDLYENLAKDPQYYFSDQYRRIKAQNHPRGYYLPMPEDWDKINFQRAIEIYKDRFADAGNYTFIIVGAFTVDSIKPLIEQYIGGLPALKREENFVDLGIRPPKGKQVHYVFKGSDPKSLAIVYFEKEKPWNERDAFMTGVLGDILEMKYIDKLREEMSGVYTVRAKASFQKIPYSFASLQLRIPCSPDNVDSLVNAAIAVIRKIQTNGVDEKDIIKVKETRRRELETAMQTNNYWITAVQDAILNETSFATVTKEEYIDQITVEEIQRITKEYFDAGEYLEVVLYPEDYRTKLEK
jgi:zinc protease